MTPLDPNGIKAPGATMSGVEDEDLATWRELLADELGDETLVAVAPADDVLDVKFDDGYGGVCGPQFLAWSATRVFFPVCYDGSESVGSAPRNPGPEGQPHVGGG